MNKTVKHLNVSLELFKADELQDVKVHPVIESVMDNLNGAFKLFLSTLKSSQLRYITQDTPIVLWDDGQGNLTVVRHVIYYYESLANNSAVYVRKRNMTEKRAFHNALEEAQFYPMLMISLLGPSMKIYKDDENPDEYETARGVTMCHAKFYKNTFEPSKQIDQRIYTNELNKASTIATILHRSPETMCKHLDLLEIRPRKKRRNPRPPLNPQRKLNLED
jgi:hypothetical protein